MVFIDGSNVYHSLKGNFNRTDIDMGKFTNKLLERRRLIRIYYYNARVGRKEEPERYVHQEKFFKSLQEVPYLELRLGRLVYNNWPTVPPYEKGVDIQLATDMITHAYKNNYDVAILVGGDSDFAPALQAVKDNGKHVEVALFGKEATSRPLREVADLVITVNSRYLKGGWKAPEPPPPHEHRPQPQQRQPRQQQQQQPRPPQQQQAQTPPTPPQPPPQTLQQWQPQTGWQPTPPPPPQQEPREY